MADVPSMEALEALLRRLPGIGPRSAQRICYDLLVRKRSLLPQLAAAFERAHGAVRFCERCNNLSEAPLCGVCRGAHRDHSQLCIVESPADLRAIEDTGVFSGDFFVLMGHLSPLDGIGPEALHLDRLSARLAETGLQEVIFATNPTLEGEATAQFLAELVPAGVTISRIAHGVPVGGELEYVDRGTLGRAMHGRRLLDE
ncbi:recombination mediator RecR [Acidithiobacillus concretivorus]|uniref:Recombination protein RecR n=1 Tax=Acidithiobacillus concretivorus TaxID=3063952 RepID=A0ABS5ZMQ9_9PROT|nr:recombination mediator RecR [Acidithiobacillus concretivorus]MBU2737902.1 recombination protein RecR [Acidithiobacillus concretivorus]